MVALWEGRITSVGCCFDQLDDGRFQDSLALSPPVIPECQIELRDLTSATENRQISLVL